MRRDILTPAENLALFILGRREGKLDTPPQIVAMTKKEIDTKPFEEFQSYLEADDSRSFNIIDDKKGSSGKFSP